jgi:hypothetical protein
MVIFDVATGPHAALLRCAQCDRFRQWLPRAAHEFLREVVRQFGRPTEPVKIFENIRPLQRSAADVTHPSAEKESNYD